MISLPCLLRGTTGIKMPDEYFALFLCDGKWSQQALYTFLCDLKKYITSTWFHTMQLRCLLLWNVNGVTTDAYFCGECIWFATVKLKAVVSIFCLLCSNDSFKPAGLACKKKNTTKLRVYTVFTCECVCVVEEFWISCSKRKSRISTTPMWKSHSAQIKLTRLTN